MSQQAAAANESRYASGVSRDFCLADALDPEYLDTDEAEKWERDGSREMHETLFGDALGSC